MTAENRPLPRWEYRAEGEIRKEGGLAITKPDPAIARRLGYPPDNLRTVTWFDRMPADDSDRAVELVQTLREGQPWRGRIQAETVEGEMVIVELQCTPTAVDATTIRVLLESREVTELARLETELAARESRLRLLGREIGTALWSTDEALRFTWSAGPALEAIGYKENALLGMSLFEFFDTEDVDHPGIKAHHQALKGLTASYDVEWQGRHWRGLLEPLHDPLDRIVGTVGVGVDLGRLLEATKAERRPHSVEHILDPRPDEDRGHAPMKLGDLTMDVDRFEVTKGGERVPVTVSEFKLLLEFARHPGRVLSRQHLAERVWGHKFYGDGASITMAISRLRDKIEDDPANPKVIETVRGVGYRSVEASS